MDMKSIRSRLTVTFIGLIAVILAVIWGVNKWYLEDFYVTKKVQALNGAYEAIDSRIEENKENGISIEDAMRREKDADGNITEGNLQRLIRNFSDSANVSVLIIDNSTEDATVYSTSRDTKFLKDRIDRYIFGWAKAKYTILEENDQYKIQKTYDPQRESMYLESWGFFSDNSTAFIMSAPLSSIGESVRLANQFLLYVGMIAVLIGALVVYLVAKQITMPIYKLSNLSERMSDLDFNAKYESGKHDMEEIQVLGNSMNTLSERLEETISELKSANNQLTKDIEEKTKIDEMRKDFIANVSHELKTPLTVILSNVGLIAASPELTDPEDKRRIGYIQAEAGRMKELVEELLFLARSDAGRLTAEKTHLDLSFLIESCALTFEPVAFEQGKLMETDVEPDLMIEGEEQKLKQLAEILLDNACKYSEPGRTIRVSLKQSSEKKLRFTVISQGTPLTKEEQKQIFERFYRADPSRGKTGGYGLGLAIAQEITRMHGGKIWAESDGEKGNRFIVEF